MARSPRKNENIPLSFGTVLQYEGYSLHSNTINSGRAIQYWIDLYLYI
jgi:hypothetical protein